MNDRATTNEESDGTGPVALTDDMIISLPLARTPEAIAKHGDAVAYLLADTEVVGLSIKIGQTVKVWQVSVRPPGGEKMRRKLGDYGETVFGKDAKGSVGYTVPQRVHVVGAGVMGGDIAAWCVLRGMTVTLQDQNVERIAPAVGRAAKFFEKKLRDKKLARFALDRLIADPKGEGVRQADVIIEAIFENLEAKQALFADIEARAKPEAVIASNTSSLKLADIAASFKDPTRLVGIHFFNPVAMMPLVEVVAGERTAPEVAQRAAAFVRRIDKLPLPVKDAPGFLVNAVLGPYMNEAMKCVDEGIAPEAIDAALVAFGMPMGPIELADTVGLDVAVHAGKQLVGDASPPKKLVELFEAGKLGKKSGQGFYTWMDGKAQKSGVGAGDTAILAERMLKPLLDATQRLVSEGVVADAELADAGVIFGTGFAPYTGGPLNYLASRY